MPRGLAILVPTLSRGAGRGLRRVRRGPSSTATAGTDNERAGSRTFGRKCRLPRTRCRISRFHPRPGSGRSTMYRSACVRRSETRICLVNRTPESIETRSDGPIRGHRARFEAGRVAEARVRAEYYGEELSKCQSKRMKRFATVLVTCLRAGYQHVRRGKSRPVYRL